MTSTSTGSPGPELPPLTVEEARRIVARLEPALGQHSLVLIGGQAVALWRAQLAAYVSPDTPLPVSRDVDFQGAGRAVGVVADLLDGTWRSPPHGAYSVLNGVVTFLDGDGHEREIDFLTAPHGLRRANVARNARLIEVDTPDGPPVRLAVMHPIDVLRSRVANSVLAEKQTQLAHEQIAAAIALVPAYGRHLLDLGGDPKEVKDMNVAAMSVAVERNRRAMRLYFEQGLDVADAVLDDERLPAEHRETELPELRARLESLRDRYASQFPPQASPPLPDVRPDARPTYERLPDPPA